MPGCVAASASVKEVRELIHKGLELHLTAAVTAKLPLPEPKTVDYDDQLDPEDELVEYGLLHVKGTVVS